MAKTNALKRIIHGMIHPIITCYYRKANNAEKYPYAIYNFENIDLGDIFRDDLILIVDVWGYGLDTDPIEEITDRIEAIFNAANLPGEEVLPTFYRVQRKPIDDEDEMIIHRQLKFQIQNYEV